MNWVCHCQVISIKCCLSLVFWLNKIYIKKINIKNKSLKNIKALVFNVSKYEDLLGKHQHGFITLKTVNFDVI